MRKVGLFSAVEICSYATLENTYFKTFHLQMNHKPTHLTAPPGESPPTSALFEEARADLKTHNIKEADRKMSRFIKKNLAVFQYLFDVAIVYSPVTMSWLDSAPGRSCVLSLSPSFVCSICACHSDYCVL